jgi:hypothetical protein
MTYLAFSRSKLSVSQTLKARALSLDYRNEERRAASIVLVVPHYALMDLSEQKMHVRQVA